jgi:hydrogenase maturation factor
MGRQHDTQRKKQGDSIHGEGCPMCTLVPDRFCLCRIVYASSSEQLVQWLNEMEVTPSSVLRRKRSYAK